MIGERSLYLLCSSFHSSLFVRTLFAGENKSIFNWSYNNILMRFDEKNAVG